MKKKLYKKKLIIKLIKNGFIGKLKNVNIKF